MLVPEVPWRNYTKIMLSSKNCCKCFETGKSCLAKFYIISWMFFLRLTWKCPVSRSFLGFIPRRKSIIAPLADWKQESEVKQEWNWKVLRQWQLRSIFGLDNQCLGKHVEMKHVEIGHCYYINNYINKTWEQWNKIHFYFSPYWGAV